MHRPGKPSLIRLQLQWDCGTWNLVNDENIIVNNVQDIHNFRNKRRAISKAGKICRELVDRKIYSGIELNIQNQDGTVNERRTYPRYLIRSVKSEKNNPKGK
jgi:hypothetical protein